MTTLLHRPLLRGTARAALLLGLLALALGAAPSGAARAAAAPVAATPAATGTIYGTITDAETGEVLPGATVRIEGTALGAATDLDGTYRIPRVPEGERTLIVSYVGYRPQRIPVTVGDDDQRVDVALVLDVVEGEEVVITAQAEGQVAAINQQLSSNKIVSVVSGARIQELPDANAAESVGRLPGISIQRDAGEGQKVVIRGLSPKYNNVTVNGVKLPATDFDNRSTDLNMVSSDMLAGVEVFKALTPDQDADAIGGTVNFRLRGAPDGFHANALVQGGYNGLTESIGQYKGNLTVSNRFFSNRLGVFAQGNLEQADRSNDQLDTDYADEQRSRTDTTRVLRVSELRIRDRDETRNRYGASLLLDYQLPFGTLQLTNFFNRLDRAYLTYDDRYDPEVRYISFDLRDTEVQTDVWSAALGGDFELGTWGQFDFSLNRSISDVSTPYDSRARFTQNSAFETVVDDEGPQRLLEFVDRTIEDAFFERIDTYNQDLEERDLGAHANLQVDYRLGSRVTGYVKTGGKLNRKTRVNDNTQYWLHLFYGGENGGLDELAALFPDAERATSGLVGIPSFLDRETYTILDDEYPFYYAVDDALGRQAQEGLFPAMKQAPWSDFRDYDSEEAVSAGYVMTEINLGSRVMLLPGVRYEHTRTRFDAFYGQVPQLDSDVEDQTVVLNDTSSTQTYGDLFPMVHLRVRPTDWFDVRLAYTRTQARPDFALTSPQVRINTSSQLIVKGTPDLRPSTAQNLDAYLSFYSNRIGLFSVGGFLKKVDGVVYEADFRLQDQETADAFGYPNYVGYRVDAPLNLDEPTYVRGVELDWQSNLLWLPRPLDGLVVSANYSRIFSETKIQRLRAETVTEPPFYIPVTTYTNYFVELPMLDQPDHVANVSVGYDKGGFSGRVSMLYQKGNLTRYGTTPGNVAYFDTYLRWDAQLSYKVRPELQLFAQLNNLTNRPDTALQSTRLTLANRQYYGSSYNLGLRYRPF